MTGALPEAAFVVALLSLPSLSPAWLGALLGQRQAGRGMTLLDTTDPSGPVEQPSAVWAEIAAGRVRILPRLGGLIGKADPAVIAAQWTATATHVDVGRLWADYTRRAISVDLLGTAGYPPELAFDDQAPFVVMRCGAHRGLEGRRVAMVGTRRATPAGRQIALDFGAVLSEAGVRVVSGLALGIDGAAHQGAITAGGAPPIGVVAGGFDLPYPARHRVLWQQVASAGVLVSESPLGIRSEGWRFAARNRIIAALSEAVVVVESREAGGSMITVDAALKRGITVMAVPGSIRNPASIGANKLIRDGAIPVCGVEDILTALSLDAVSLAAAPDSRPAPSQRGAALLEVIGWEPTPTSTVIARTGLDPAHVAVELSHLELDGWICTSGGWWQRIDDRGRLR